MAPLAVAQANTIRLALQENPVGQLAWMGEKFLDVSDPGAGTGPSVLDHNEILRIFSLFYLAQSFTSAVFIYYQNPNVVRTSYIGAKTNAPLLFSSSKYNIFFYPGPMVEKVGNLVYYNSNCSDPSLFREKDGPDETCRLQLTTLEDAFRVWITRLP